MWKHIHILLYIKSKFNYACFVLAKSIRVIARNSTVSPETHLSGGENYFYLTGKKQVDFMIVCCIFLLLLTLSI